MNLIINPNDSIAAVIDGQEFTIRCGHPSFSEVLKAIAERRPESEIKALFEPAKAFASYSDGKVEVKDGILSYEGEPIHNVVADRIIEFIEQGLPFEPLVKFLERLQANSSRRSIEELYRFLEHGNMPITEDGHFLAYKGVREDYSDVHTGRFSNRVGSVLSMPRAKVDDDFRRGCSYGFHAGSLDYATNFGVRTVIVKIDPADVVSVPEECEFQKLRTMRYAVVADYNGPLHKPFYEDVDDDIYSEDDVEEEAPAAVSNEEAIARLKEAIRELADVAAAL